MTSPQDAAPEPTSEFSAEPTFRPVEAIAPTAPIAAHDPLSFRSRERHRAGLAAALAATTAAAACFAALIMMAPPRPEVPDSVETAAIEDTPRAQEATFQPVAARTAVAADDAGAQPVPAPEKATAAIMAPSLAGGSPRWAQLNVPAEARTESLTGEARDETLAGNPPRRMTAPDLPELETWEAENHPVEPDADEIDPSVTAAIGDPAYERTARATHYVNLRAKPADEAKVLTVVPANGELAVVGCERWCEVEYDGTRGFIYKRFVR
ncbi:MAG: SH3 domain-containing protein [Rhizobiaceae bacterium]|nr:SH3 domain-containing protein [Rhizobiaceae bacterium]